MCDKGYHTFCLQPAMDSLPTNGWRCKVGKTSCNAGWLIYDKIVLYGLQKMFKSCVTLCETK